MSQNSLAVFVCIKPVRMSVNGVSEEKIYLPGDLKALDSGCKDNEFWEKTGLPWIMLKPVNISIDKNFNEYVGAP